MAARRKTDALSEREAEIMSVLWTLGESTADQIRENLDGDPHDSTVRTLLRVMQGKGYVRTRSRTRPTVYRAAIEQPNVQRSAAKNLLARFFGGSAEALVLRLLADEQLSPEQLEQLKLDYLRRGREKGKS